MVTEANWQNWDEAQLRPYLGTVFDAFGPGRVMFGSNWPVCLVASTYKHWIKVLERAMTALSDAEQCRFWGENAARIYRLDRA